MKILFICTHNRCRSILAEAIANHVGAPHIKAASAGSLPSGVVHPLTLTYLLKHGVDTHDLQSQSWDEFINFSPDAVITLCDTAARETCPVWFGNGVQAHWGLDDPSKQCMTNDNEQSQEDAFNNTIRILQQRIQRLIEVLDKPVHLNSDKAARKDALLNALERIADEIN